MTDATTGFGTILKIGDGGGPENFTAIAEVHDISGPSLSRDTVETTHQQSTEKWKEFIAGLKDAGEVSFDISYLPTHATHDNTTGLLKDFDDGTLRNFELVFPDSGATTWSFSALVTGYEPTAPKEDKLTAAITLKVSGKPTLA